MGIKKSLEVMPAQANEFMLYLCFYPILLVIGFIFSMSVVKVLGGFWLDWSMWLVEDAETNSMSGIFALFAYVALFIFGMMMIVNRTFESLLVKVPDYRFFQHFHVVIPKPAPVSSPPGSARHPAF